MTLKQSLWGMAAMTFALASTGAGVAQAATVPTTADGFTQMFADKNDQIWSGGDQMTSFAAPNGKVYWLSGDTMQSNGTAADGSYPAGTTVASNRILLQSGNTLSNAMAKGGIGIPDPATHTSANGERYWAQGLFYANNTLYALAQRVINQNGSFQVIGTELAKYTIATNGLLTFTGMASTPGTGIAGGQGPTHIQWSGDAIVKDGYVYIYGYTLAPTTSPQYVIHNTYLARVTTAQVTSASAWTYYQKSTGAWVASMAQLSADATSPDSLVGSQVSSVRLINGKVVMAHKPWNGWGSAVYIETSANPWGPFVSTKVFDSPANTWQGKDYSTYGPMLHPEQALAGADAGKLLMSIDWNGQNFYTDVMGNADLYKPRFTAVLQP